MREFIGEASHGEEQGVLAANRFQEVQTRMEAFHRLDGFSRIRPLTGQAIQVVDQFCGEALAEFPLRQFQQLSNAGHTHVGQPFEFLLGEIHCGERCGAHGHHRIARSLAQSSPGENQRSQRGGCRREPVNVSETCIELRNRFLERCAALEQAQAAAALDQEGIGKCQADLRTESITRLAKGFESLCLPFRIALKVHEFRRDAVRCRQRAADGDAGALRARVGLEDAIVVDQDDGTIRFGVGIVALDLEAQQGKVCCEPEHSVIPRPRLAWTVIRHGARNARAASVQAVRASVGGAASALFRE